MQTVISKGIKFDMTLLIIKTLITKCLDKNVNFFSSSGYGRRITKRQSCADGRCFSLKAKLPERRN